MAKLKADRSFDTHGTGNLVTNENLNYNIARYLLESGLATEDDFEELPKKEEKNKKNNK